MTGKMVEAFKTNIHKKTQSKILLGKLTEAFPGLTINFDLSDCDRVLRVEGGNIEALPIMSFVKQHGFACEVLD